MSRWWAGAALLGAALAWFVADWLLDTYLPLVWGGPNIGGGLLDLLAVAVAAGGVVLMATAVSELPAHPLRRPHLVVWAPAAVDAALLVALAVVHVALPGDSGPGGRLAGINGQVGVSADAAGDPVLDLQVCAGSVGTVSVVGPNRGDQPNAQVATLRAASPVTAPTRVALPAPTPGWSGAPSVLPWAANRFLIADAYGEQSELVQVDFTAADLRELAAAGPDTVQFTDLRPEAASEDDFSSRRATRAAFHDAACAGYPDQPTAGSS